MVRAVARKYREILLGSVAGLDEGEYGYDAGRNVGASRVSRDTDPIKGRREREREIRGSSVRLLYRGRLARRDRQ